MRNAQGNIRVTMPDGSQYDVPVCIVARDRALNYVDEFDGDVERSLEEDTIPLFDEDAFEIEDWAKNNMNWSEVRPHASLHRPSEVDYQEGWVNGDMEIIPA